MNRESDKKPMVPNSVVNNRMFRGWTRERAENTPLLAVGRQPVSTLRPSITKRTRHRAGLIYVTFDASVRGKNSARTYLRTYETREEAEEACRIFIETGERPEPGQRGPTGKQLKPRAPRDPKSAPLPRKKRQTKQQTAKREETVPVSTPPQTTKQPIDRIALMRKIMAEKFTQ